MADPRSILAGLRLDYTQAPDHVWRRSPYHVDTLHQRTADLVLRGIEEARDSSDASLRVTNGGSLPLTFTVGGAGSGAADLAAALRVSVFPGVTDGVCSGTALVSDVAATGPILAAQPVLASADARDLCFRVTLPTGADTSLQGKSSTLTLTFTAANA